MELFSIPFEPTERVDAMPDERVDACFRLAGRAHKESARVLIGLVGEVDRRNIPWRAGMTGLAEYAQRVGGLSESQIELALRLDRATRSLPRLRELFQHGRVSPHKLRVVLGCATPALDALLADLVMRLPKAELEAWVRQHRRETEGQNPPPEPRLEETPVAGTGVPESTDTPAGAPGAEPVPAREDRKEPPVPPATGSATLSVSALVYEPLVHEQARLSATRGRPVSMDELLLHLLYGEDRSRARYFPVVTTTPAGEPVALKTCRGGVPITSSDLAGWTPACAPIDLAKDRARLGAALARDLGRSGRRPAQVDRHVRARSGDVCELSGCGRPGTGTHHWVPRAAKGTHHPDNLSRLCATHMGLADRGLLARQRGGRITLAAAGASSPHAAIHRRYEEERLRAIARRSNGVPKRRVGGRSSRSRPVSRKVGR